LSYTTTQRSCNQFASNKRANNVTLNSTLNAGSYNQLTGSGTTNFGTTNGLIVNGNITINTNVISGNLVGSSTMLNGALDLNMSLNNVQVTSLVLNGLSGGSVVGSVNSFGGLQAAMLTGLGIGNGGIFTMNGYILPVIMPIIPVNPNPSFVSVFKSNFSISPGIIFPNYIYNETSFFEEFIIPAMPINRIYSKNFLLVEVLSTTENPLALETSLYQNRLIMQDIGL
jgi:hypothetical protein